MCANLIADFPLFKLPTGYVPAGAPPEGPQKGPSFLLYFPALLPGSFVGTYFPKAKVKNFVKFIDETIEKIKSEKYDQVNYVRLKQLGESILLDS